jgi:hypothetical protein
MYAHAHASAASCDCNTVPCPIATQARVREALQGALQLLGGFLLDGQLRQPLQEELLVERLLGALLGLARLQGAAAVREAALQVLTAAMELPYHLLHPHRQQVRGGARLGGARPAGCRDLLLVHSPPGRGSVRSPQWACTGPSTCQPGY